MMARPLRIAQLSGDATTAAVAAGPSCLDAAQAGTSLWVAAKAGQHCVQVLHAPAGTLQTSSNSTGGSGGSGSLHAVIHLPEPVAAVQLGVPTAAASAARAAAGAAILLAVGQSCRVWAFQLQPQPAAEGTVPAELQADTSAAAAVPVGQQQCPAWHQLAAAVAWEHLAYAWDPAAAADQRQRTGGSRGSRSRSGASHGAAVAPLSLASLQVALQQQFGGSGEQVPALVHTVSGWVCQPAGPGGIPADATAVAYLGAASAAGPSSRLLSSTRYELATGAASGSAAGGPIGHLLLATASGQLHSLPVGTACTGAADQQPQQQGSSPQAATVCYHSSSICFLQSSNRGSAAGSGQAQQRLLLLAESGRLVPAAASGLGCSEAVVLAAGRHGSSSSPGCSSGSSTELLPLPSLQLVGAAAAAAMGSSLCYLVSCQPSSSRRLRYLDASRGLPADTAVAAADMRAGSVALLASAACEGGAQQLVLLTEKGELLSAPLPSPEQQAQAGSGSASVRQLEGSMQVGSFGSG